MLTYANPTQEYGMAGTPQPLPMPPLPQITAGPTTQARDPNAVSTMNPNWQQNYNAVYGVGGSMEGKDQGAMLQRVGAPVNNMMGNTEPTDGAIRPPTPGLPPGTTGYKPPGGSIGVTPPPPTLPPPPQGTTGGTSPPPGGTAAPTSMPAGFPTNPTAGQTYNYNGQQYTFTNGQWAKSSGLNRPGPTIPGRPGPPGTLPPGSQNPGDGPVTQPPLRPGGTGGTTGGTPPPGVGGTPPPYSTTLPSVDPYDISDSPKPTGSSYGGVSAVNPTASAFDYNSVNQFSDAAYAQSRRYLDPQLKLEDERFTQELINKGIDPNSDAGKKAFAQKEMSQNDLESKAAFDAMGYGSNLQNQMFGQSAKRSDLAQALLQAQWGLGQRGHEFDTTAGMTADDQAFAQMMGLEGLDYRDYQTLIDQRRYQDSLALALSGLSNAPSYQTINTGLPQAPVTQYQGQSYLGPRSIGG